MRYKKVPIKNSLTGVELKFTIAATIQSSHVLGNTCSTFTLIDVNATRKLSQDDRCLAEATPDTESSLDPAKDSCSRQRDRSFFMWDIQTIAWSLVNATPT